MSSFIFSILFFSFLILTLIIKVWLNLRHIRYISIHRNVLPKEFSKKINLLAHQKAADYTIAKIKFEFLLLSINTIVIVFFTLFGGLQLISNFILKLVNIQMLYQLSLIASFVLISSLINLPFNYYQHFVLENHFCFNKMSIKLFFIDILKNIFISGLIGLPLLWIVLTLMDKLHAAWWFYTWLIWSIFQYLVFILYPNIIAPIFNKFTIISDKNLLTRIENIMQRVGFSTKALFIIDSSKRTTHSNVYFSGFGKCKRIVFFDTLLTRLTYNEIEAVLAHELGHFKLRHISKRIFYICIIFLIFLLLLDFLKNHIWFYTGLGVNPLFFWNNDAFALILFILILPIFIFPLTPLFSLLSRTYEFEADAFAAKYTNAQELVSALIKLYEDNASTLTPDPWYSAVYDSHPPALIRIKKLLHNT